SPSMTTVAQHGFTMGKQVVELLIERIENESEDYKPKKIVISSDLKLRESTKPSS
ncbi:MAG: LacI family transcriptional regulator, partial [Flavobacteriales bacterium]